MKTLLGLFAFATVTLATGFGLAENPETKRTLIAASADSAKGKAQIPADLEDKSDRSVSSDSVAALLNFAHSFMGLQYKSGGSTPAGFDCSGFTHFVYRKFGYNVPHGSVNQAIVGQKIKESEARKGDLLIFTGTNLSDRTPGHVGIVISEKGEPIRFIHSSSNGGVKISEVTGTRYTQRLLQIRRVL